MITRSITEDSVSTSYSLSYDSEDHMIAVSGGTVTDSYVYRWRRICNLAKKFAIIVLMSQNPKHL
jgi:hypothetical protein